MTVRVVLIILMTLFMPLTALSFFRFSLRKKEMAYQQTLQLMGLKKGEPGSSVQAVREEYAPADFALPVSFVTVICFIGSFILLMGGEFYVSAGYNILLAGVSFPPFEHDPLPHQIQYLQSMVVLSFAFLGAYLWAAQNIARRLISADIVPSLYYSAGLRMIFASVIGLMMAFLLGASPTEAYTTGLLPVIAFITGMFPQQMLFFLRNQVQTILGMGRETSHELPLDMIEGLNTFNIVRLNEAGIDNGQNLAEANLTDLLRQTPFTAPHLIDWIAQAKLYVYFKSDVEKLRAIGIRTIFDLQAVNNPAERLPQIAEQTGLSLLTLNLVYEHTAADEAVAALHTNQIRLNAHLKGNPYDHSGDQAQPQS